MAFLHVCRYWRVLLLGHRRAWSNIHLRGQDPDFLTWQMAHARDAPLYVTVHLHSNIFNSNNPFLRNLCASVKVVQQHRHKVRRISVHVSRSHSFPSFFGFDLPNLEELAWEGEERGYPTSPNSPAWTSSRYPKLRCLSVKGTLRWPMQTTIGLTRFKLEGPMAIIFKDISGFLQRNKTLEVVEFENLLIPIPTPGESERVELPNLSSLSFRNVAHGHVFPFLSLPALESLSIEPFEQSVPWSPTIWSDLSLPVGITSLNMKYRVWEGGSNEVCITGFDEGRTRSLSLTERSVGRRFNPMLSALAQASLHSVTSISFDEEGPSDPRHGLFCESLPMILKNLPNLRRMDLCWGHLTRQILEHLGHEFPELEVLRVKTTRLTCSATFDLAFRVAETRANSGMPLCKVELLVAEEESDAEEIRAIWDTLARNAELERYLCSRQQELIVT